MGDRQTEVVAAHELGRGRWRRDDWLQWLSGGVSGKDDGEARGEN
jgi:hypothetical protein